MNFEITIQKYFLGMLSIGRNFMDSSFCRESDYKESYENRIKFKNRCRLIKTMIIRILKGNQALNALFSSSQSILK